MGNVHRDQWTKALPWVLLGKRMAYQPHLDASSAQLVLGCSLKAPGMLLGDPGQPLKKNETKILLDQLYKLAARPPIQTSSQPKKLDIENTKDATHVYIKTANPLSLCPKFEGPYPITARPSRSQVTVKLGLFADGSMREQTYHWSSCRVANMREDAPDGFRPKLGRPAKAATLPESAPTTVPDPLETKSTERNVNKLPTSTGSNQNKQVSKSDGKRSGKIQTASATNNRSGRSTRNPSPNYVSGVAWQASQADIDDLNAKIARVQGPQFMSLV